jgi:hypothetical protein
MTRAYDVFAISILLALSACAASGDYPSLAKRSFESAAADPPASQPLPAIPNDSSLQTRIAASLALAKSGASAFAAALADADSKASAASGLASESWIAAQLSLSRVERTLEPATTALANLDSEKRLLMLAAPASPDIEALDAAIGQIAEINAAQREALSRLGARLSR